ncbi:MAG: hypothetical protein ACI4TM_06705 [Candidatus Cryptobacteroides sp.]
MENKENQVYVNIESYTGENPIEIIFRKGDAAPSPSPLETKAPVNIDISGVITTPLEWLKKRVDTINQKRANIVVNREEMTIKLTVNERDYYEKSEIVGKIEYSDIFKKFRINDPMSGWEPSALGQFLRLNRCLFVDKQSCFGLVSVLKNFQAKCNSDIQKMRDPSGSSAEVYRTNVESNLPKSFSVSLPIFKGTAKQAIEIEFDHFLMDNKVLLQLVSPGAMEVTVDYRDVIIDKVLNDIREIAPDIAILEK